MSARMVATRRNYTRDEKAAYRARLEARRYADAFLTGEVIGRGLRFWTPARTAQLTEAGRAASQVLKNLTATARQEAGRVMDLNATRRMGLGGWAADHVVVDELAAMPAQFIHTRGPQEGQPITAQRQALPTAEQILGMDSATPRRTQLEDILDLPPTPIRQRQLPEEWIQP